MHSNARATEHHQLHAEGRASLESYSGEDGASTSVAIKFWWIGVVVVPLTRGLGGELLPGRFTASGLASCLLGTSHDERLSTVVEFVVNNYWIVPPYSYSSGTSIRRWYAYIIVEDRRLKREF